jgi:hypothetical protein
MYVGQVMGGNDGSPKMVKVRMKGGSEEWKSRDAIISGNWYVDSNDPAIKQMEWEIYSE